MEMFVKGSTTIERCAAFAGGGALDTMEAIRLAPARYQKPPAITASAIIPAPSITSLAYRTISIYVFLQTGMCSPVRASQIAHALKLPRVSVVRRASGSIGSQ